MVMCNGRRYLLLHYWLKSKMDKRIMRNKKTSTLGIVLGFFMLLAGVQGAVAACMGTVYFKAPNDWTQAVFSGQNLSTPAVVTEKDENGYFSLDLATLGLENYVQKFSISNSTTSGMNSYIVTDTVWMHQNPYDANAIQNMATIPCPTTATGMVYVAENVLKPGTAYIGSTPPDAKFFYVLLPEEKEWQSDDLMISYTKNGVKKDTAMIPSPDYCGWFYMVFDKAPADAILYLKHQPDVQLGINGTWDDDGVADPMDLDVVFDETDQMFFILDDAAWPDDVNKGWYEAFPGVEGTCSFNLAAIIYDSDESLINVFTHDPDNSGFGACVGVHTGIVKTDLGPDGKPQFSGSANAVKCFGTESNFKTLFNYTPGINEMQCYDMPFRHYGMDTRWGFDSDSTHYDAEGNELATGGFTGGFYPLEHSSNETVVVINGVPQGPTPVARTKRKAEAPVGMVPAFADLDHYCNTPGWFDGVDCGATNMFKNGDTPAAWDWGVRQNWSEMNGGDLLRNQQYCFQSHATFTYNEDQEFTFRGDDDIWVFINKKIAVDNGGAHLAAPGHVVLKNLNTTYGAGFLVPGNDYDLDIFFCDRRTTMTNVIIKTNMYIKQSTGLDFTSKQNASGGLEMNICVETSGGGDCASVALGSGGQAGQEVTRECGGDIKANITYSITTRKGEIPSGCQDCAALPLGGMIHGGIDLTNPKVPVVYPDKIGGLAPGSYRLVIEVNGKKTYYSFRIKGNLGLVTRDVVFENVDNEQSVYAKNTKWTFVDKAMAGTRIPVYISAPDEYGGVDLISAPNQPYVFTLTTGATLYKTNDPNSPDYNKVLSVPYSGVVNQTGIDTLWVEVPLAGLASGTQEVTAAVGNSSAKLTFYAPYITFAEPATKDSLGNPLTWNAVSQDPDKDETGEDFYRWVGMDVDLYLIAMNPITNGLCTECNFLVDMTEASPGISGNVSSFNEGVAIVRINSRTPYDVTPASIVVASVDNPAIAAPYDNLHFFKPPVPTPVLVDVFDVKGVALGEMNIPAEFHNKNAEYLDGRADSIVIVYNEPFHAADSIPTHICLNFDDRNLNKIKPYKDGLSNNPKDSTMYCSTEFDSSAIRIAYNNRLNDSTLVFVVDVDKSFSEEAKTSVSMSNKLSSFASFKKGNKELLTFFDKGLTDRMAPIILSARVKTEEKYPEYDQMRIVLSEPVSVVEAAYGVSAFTYFLNSAVDLTVESDRYRDVIAENAPTNKKDTLTIRYNNSNPSNPTPHVGDYIRFRADQLVWSDTADIGAGAAIRADDASMHWNSPTKLEDPTGRLPSPWVQVVGDAKISVTTISFNYANPEAITDSTPVGEVFPVMTNQNMKDVEKDHPGTLGHFVKSDMGSIIGSDDAYVTIDKGEIYFAYSVDYYTNLGTYVAHQGGKIKCNDKFFSPDPATTPEGMGDCVRYPRNFYVAWNMLSDKHRLVGTGAYITKYSSFVKLGNMGKKAKKELTEVWGVKRGKGKIEK